MSVCYKRIFRYRFSPGTSGYTVVGVTVELTSGRDTCCLAYFLKYTPHPKKFQIKVECREISSYEFFFFCYDEHF
jgi:hypothetical protein